MFTFVILSWCVCSGCFDLRDLEAEQPTQTPRHRQWHKFGLSTFPVLDGGTTWSAPKQL